MLSEDLNKLVNLLIKLLQVAFQSVLGAKTVNSRVSAALVIVFCCKMKNRNYGFSYNKAGRKKT